MKRIEFAKLKGITTAELKTLEIDFLENEGYLDDGTECETLSKYIDARLKKQMIMKNENEKSIIACEQGKICGAL